MNDILMLFAAVGVCIVVVCFGYIVEYFRDCRHKWGMWKGYETDHAYVNQRCCEKCGFVQVSQHRKMTEGL